MTNTATTPPAGMRWREVPFTTARGGNNHIARHTGQWEHAYHERRVFSTVPNFAALGVSAEDEDAVFALKANPLEPATPAPKDAPTMTTTENTTPKDAPTMTTTESTTPASLIGRHALITTAHRGVFAGRVLAVDGTTVTLADARCAIYWSEAMKGVWGLAATGPDKGCRIGAAVPEVTLWSVTAMAPCTDAAVAAWEAAPWR